MTKDTITVRQLFIMYILVTLSPAIRLFPAVCAKYGRAAGWLAPIIAAVVPFLLVKVISELYKKQSFGSFGETLDASFGKIAGKALLVLYLLWTIVVFSLYLRYYAERLVTSLFTTTRPDFFIIALLALVYIAARGRLVTLARFSEIAILVLSVIFVIFMISLLPTFKLRNVLPVTYYDTVPVLRSAFPIVTIWCYVTPLFFFAGHIANKSEIRRHGYKAAGLAAISSAVMVFIVVGSLGADAAARMPLAFFKVSKLIDIMQSFDRFEAVISSFWIIADFILAAVLACVITNITSELFGSGKPKSFAAPVVIAGFAGSLLISDSWYGLQALSGSVLAHGLTIALCAGVPVLALAAGRIRKKL